METSAVKVSEKGNSAFLVFVELNWYTVLSRFWIYITDSQCWVHFVLSLRKEEHIEVVNRRLCQYS